MQTCPGHTMAPFEPGSHGGHGGGSPMLQAACLNPHVHTTDVVPCKGQEGWVMKRQHGVREMSP